MSRYEIVAQDLPLFGWRHFELLQSYSNILNRQTVKPSSCEIYISFIETELTIPGIRGGITFIKELKFFIFRFWNENYGHIFIRQETFEDKVNEFFEHKEIDFTDDADFSNRFM